MCPFMHDYRATFHMSKVKLTTNHGDIVLQLNAEKAPLTVANFIEYVNAGHYENTVFHRVIGNLDRKSVV